MADGFYGILFENAQRFRMLSEKMPWRVLPSPEAPLASCTEARGEWGKIVEKGAFPLYRNEAYLYRFWGLSVGGRPSFLPEVLEVQLADDEIFILMKRYQELARAEADDRLLRKIMGTLAMIHAQDIRPLLGKESGMSMRKWAYRHKLLTDLEGDIIWWSWFSE